jgi:UDP-glucose 4-epimerase
MYDVKKVIQASTSEVYGSSLYHPMDEKHPLNAPHPYGASKIAADRLCHAYIQTYGMDICILRFFNTFGPRQKDIGYGGVISIFTKRILNDMPPIIFGDGLQTRDYIYIDDAVKAYDTVLNHDKPITEPINFGSGKEFTILELANTIIEYCGKKDTLEPIHVEPRAVEVMRLIADSSRAKEVLGWEITVDMKEGLKSYLQWYKGHGL